MYVPPFTITSHIINLIAEISAQIERYTIRLEQANELRLRKANRITTIHSSLAIEGNTLSEEQVRDIINGKSVIAPMREVQEVKNAIATYDLYPTLNPFDTQDLLRAHATMMMGLADDAGHFRHGNVGVFGEKGCVHMAPPASRVPILIAELFDWLKHSSDHLLIRSCVFHYEFEFIHPFSDGNGRTGRLWQSLILGQLHPLFQYLPVENLVFANQQAYYEAIAASTAAGESTPFIEFMLGEILAALKAHQRDEHTSDREYVPIKQHDRLPNKVPNKVPNIIPNNYRKLHPDVSDVVWHIATLIYHAPGASADDIGEVLGITGRTVRKHISRLRGLGLITRVGSNKTGYWKVNRPL